MSPAKNNKNIAVDNLDFVLTKTHAAIAEDTDITVSEQRVIIVEEITLDEYLILGLFQISTTFDHN